MVILSLLRSLAIWKYFTQRTEMMQNCPFLEAIKGKVFFNKLGRDSCQMQSLGTTVCWAVGHSPRAWIWALEMQDGLKEGALPPGSSGSAEQAPFSGKIIFICTHRLLEQWLSLTIQGINGIFLQDLPLLRFGGAQHPKPHVNTLSMSGKQPAARAGGETSQKTRLWPNCSHWRHPVHPHWFHCGKSWASAFYCSSLYEEFEIFLVMQSNRIIVPAPKSGWKARPNSFLAHFTLLMPEFIWRFL